ncbi:hypothetical protein KSP39_PZI014013 [Platanthera zijinensis]|uniref:Uncharacterized protein n=1 Tax=Platanthera zijinensis TaxID=2320716 RepID=A0AAP0BC69_9ASPA
MSSRIKLNIPEIKEWAFTSSSTDDSMTGTISGEEVILTPAVVTDIFGLINGEEDYEQDTQEFGRMLVELGHAEGIPMKLLKVNFPFKIKFLAELVGKVLLGKHSAHDNITRQQFALMCAIVNQKKIDWAGVMFDLIRKKNGKKEVTLGRVIGIFLKEKYPQLLSSTAITINASKKMDPNLFSKWKRTFVKPALTGVAPATSESTRTDSVAPHPVEAGSALSRPSSSAMQSASVEVPSTSAEVRLSPSPVRETATVALPSPPASPLPSHQARISAPSFDLLGSERIPTPPLSPIHSPVNTPVNSPAPSPLRSPVHTILHPNTTTISAASPSTALPSSFEITPELISRIVELITPSIKTMIEEAIAPLASSIDTLTATIKSLSKSAEPSSSRGLVSVSTEIRQGEMFCEDASEPPASLPAVTDTVMTVQVVSAPAEKGSASVLSEKEISDAIMLSEFVVKVCLEDLTSPVIANFLEGIITSYLDESWELHPFSPLIFSPPLLSLAVNCFSHSPF